MKNTKNISCPRCGGKKKAGIAMMNDTQIVNGKVAHFTVMTSVWKCSRCGHSHR